MVTNINSRHGEGFREERVAQRKAEVAYHIDMLKSRDPMRRETAANRLGHLKAGIPELINALHDPHSRVRVAAAEALASVEDDDRAEVIDHLLASIDDSQDMVSATAIRALGRLKADEAKDQITPFLDNAGPLLVSATIEALGQLSAIELAPHIKPFLDSPNPHIQAAAIRCLARFGEQSVGPRLLATLQAIHERGMDSVPTKLVVALLEALSTLQVREAVPIINCIALHDVGFRTKAVRALCELRADEAAPSLAPLLIDPSSPLRESLIRLMLQTGYRAAMPIIRPLLRDAKVSVRQLALMVVQQWSDQGSVARVRRMCHNDPSSHVRPQAVRVLVALIGAEAVPELITLASDRNTVVRRAVADGFAQLDTIPVTAIRTLNDLASDADETVSQVAHTVLVRQQIDQMEIGAMPQPQPVPLPSELYPELPDLLASLERWQLGLATQVGRCDAQAVTNVDSALTTLLNAIRSSAPDNTAATNANDGVFS